MRMDVVYRQKRNLLGERDRLSRCEPNEQRPGESWRVGHSDGAQSSKRHLGFGKCVVDHWKNPFVDAAVKPERTKSSVRLI